MNTEKRKRSLRSIRRGMAEPSEDFPFDEFGEDEIELESYAVENVSTFPAAAVAVGIAAVLAAGAAAVYMRMRKKH